MTSLVFIVGAYLIGSVSFAVLMSKAFGLPDPRTYGSNNPGATNVLRTGKKAAAALTLLGDAAKGWLAVWLARHFQPDGEALVAVVALAVFLGHVFPVFLKFQGGKGVATALGVLLALSGWLGLAALGTWLVMALVFRYSSLAALTAAVAAPVYASLLKLPPLWALSALLMSFLLVWRHKGNIRKLAAGEESKIGARKAKASSAEEA